MTSEQHISDVIGRLERMKYTTAQGIGQEMQSFNDGISAAIMVISNASPITEKVVEGVDDMQILQIAHKIQSICSEKLTVEEGEIIGLGPASYKIARLFKPVVTPSTSSEGKP